MLFLLTQVATVAVTTVRIDHVPHILFNLLGLLPSFILWFATPAILVRHGATGWKHLAWCGVAGVVIDAVLIRLVTRILLPALLSGWEGFGPISRRR